MQRILVTPRSATRTGHPALDRLREAGFEIVMCTPGVQPDEEELLQLLPGCVGYLAGVEAVSQKVLAAAKGLQVISRNGVGTDAIDVQAAQQFGIKVLNTPGANSRGVAELTIGLMLSLVRSLPAADASLKSGLWKRTCGVEIDGRCLGVIGCGNIGRRVANMAIALGMSVVGYDLFPRDDFAPDGFSWETFDAVLKCDIVTLHCPPSKEPLISSNALSQMNHGAWLINTARADLVDEDSILAALDSGQLAGYATDAFHEEPPVNRRLVEHPLVIATPHIGGFTAESVDNAIGRAVDGIINTLVPQER